MNTDETGNRREDAGWPMRKALVRLRMVEAKAQNYLPVDLMHEFSDSLEALVSIIRKTEPPK